MSEFFAISTVEETFIVRAGTDEELSDRIQEIWSKYPDWANRFIQPGYMVIQADDIRGAVKIAREMKNAGKVIYGPLFEPVQIHWSAAAAQEPAVSADQ